MVYKIVTSKNMYEHASPWSIVRLTLIQARVRGGGCLEYEGHGGHLGLVHHDGHSSAGSPDS